MLKTIPLVLALAASASIEAKEVIHADVKVHYLVSQDGEQLWQPLDTINTPRYPIELARNGIAGCAVVGFDISPEGKPKNIEVIARQPQRHARELRKATREYIRNWQLPSRESSEDLPMALRFDYCIGGKNDEQAQALCAKAITKPCA